MLTPRRTFLLASVAAFLAPLSGVGREVAGLVLPEEAKLAVDVPGLPLVGAGVFRYFFLSVYVCGFYLPPRHTWGGDPLRSDAARRVSLVMLRSVSARLFLWGLDRGLTDNTPQSELAALAEPLERLRRVIRGTHTLEAGTRVNIDYLPGRGTQIHVGERGVGEVIAGKTLNDAVLRVWVGEKPLDPGLKEALVGA